MKNSFSAPGGIQTLFENTPIIVEVSQQDDETRVAWQAACNIMSAPATLQQSRLALQDEVISTAMACENERETEQDRWLTDFFMSEPLWQQQDDTLVVRSEDLTTTIEFRGASPSPKEDATDEDVAQSPSEFPSAGPYPAGVTPAPAEPFLDELDVVASGVLGETVDVRGVELTVLSIDPDAEHESPTRPEWQSPFVIDMRIRNTTSEEFRWGERDFSITDEHGHTFHSKCCADEYGKQHAPAGVAPGETVEGTWVFEMDIGAANVTLMYASDEMSYAGEVALIELIEDGRPVTAPASN